MRPNTSTSWSRSRMHSRCLDDVLLEHDLAKARQCPVLLIGAVPRRRQPASVIGGLVGTHPREDVGAAIVSGDEADLSPFDLLIPIFSKRFKPGAGGRSS
jgi:hypothetical protein